MGLSLNSIVFEKSMLIPNTIPGVKLEPKLTPWRQEMQETMIVNKFSLKLSSIHHEKTHHFSNPRFIKFSMNYHANKRNVSPKKKCFLQRLLTLHTK